MKTHKTLSSDAMTLTELIVASVLVGIVMMGVIAFDYFIRVSRNSAAAMEQLTFEATTAMAALTSAAEMAQGSYSSNSDPAQRALVEGVYTHRDTTQNMICFRHFVDGSSDDWTCFMQPLIYFENIWTGNRDCHRDILQCAPMSDNDIVSAAADPAYAFTGWGCFADRPVAILRVADDTDAGQPFYFFNVVKDNDRIQYIEFTLKKLYDRTQAYHPIKNPRISISTRVYPPGLTQ